MGRKWTLDSSVQINDGLTQTSADGANMAFDKTYGIMFCVYMPGPQGHYGESRGRISLTYFPASQPTNARTIDVTCDKDVYVPNVLSLGDGKVRVFYEKDSKADCDHDICYKDYDFLSQTLSEEKTVMLKQENGELVALTSSQQFAYLEKNGHFNHRYKATEQISIGGHTFLRGDDGYIYGAITSYFAEPILYRSSDNLATVEFFAVMPFTAQYEADYKFLNGKIHAVFRTPAERDSIFYTTSDDNGKSWTQPALIKDSVSCRPRLITYHNRILVLANHYDDNTGNRPAVQQGRTSVRLYLVDNTAPDESNLLLELHSKCGMVNACIIDILGDVYLAYSTSELALEYQNGNPKVRGKDAIRYIKLGDLTL